MDGANAAEWFAAAEGDPSGDGADGARFEAAADAVKTRGAGLSDEHKLELYGHFKQVCVVCSRRRPHANNVFFLTVSR